MLTMETVIDCVYDGVYVVNAAREIVFWSRGAERITGYAKPEVQGRPCGLSLLAHVSDDGCRLCENKCPLTATLADGIGRQARVFLRHSKGHRVAVDVHTERMVDQDGTVFGVETFSDRRSKQTADTSGQDLGTGRRDPLTGLATGLSMRFQLHTLLAESRVFGLPIAGLLVELTGLDEVRRLYGSAIMDQWISSAARTLADALPNASVSRWREEAFVALDAEIKSAWELTVQGDRVREILKASGVANGQDIAGLAVEVSTTLSVPHDTVDNFIERLRNIHSRQLAASAVGLIDGDIVAPTPGAGLGHIAGDIVAL